MQIGFVHMQSDDNGCDVQSLFFILQSSFYHDDEQDYQRNYKEQTHDIF